MPLKESGTLWGANFAKQIAKHGGHACLEVSNLKFTFVNFSGPPQKQKVIISPVGACFFPKSARNLLER